MPWWLRVDVRERTRLAHAQSKRKSLAHSREATTAQRFFAAAADKPNRSGSRTQQRWQRGSGGGQIRASEPPIVRLITPCLGGCALFGSFMCALPVLFVGCVVSRVFCVVYWLFLAMIRTYMIVYVLFRGFFATTRKHVRREKLSQSQNRNRLFARKRYTVTVKGISVSPSWFCCSLSS